MHHFHNFSLASLHPWTPLGDFSGPHNFPTFGKNLVGAHGGGNKLILFNAPLMMVMSFSGKFEIINISHNYILP